VRVDRNGAVTVFSGSADLGQGSQQMLATLVADRLGLQPSDIRVVEADTRLTPVDLGSYSSRVTMMAGNAALQAADAVRAQVLDAAATQLGTAASELRLEDGRIHVAGDVSVGVSFVRAAQLAEARLGAVGATAGFRPPLQGSRHRRESVGPSPAYSFTAQVAEVEVDEDTGVVRVVQVWVAHDCGRALQPSIVEGQVEGCVAMGLGEALHEETVHRDGRLVAPSLLAYKVPTIHETPPIEVTLVETHDPIGPLGAKECGEGPQLGTVPAVANAIHDAIGIRLDAPPFTPERVLRALDARGRAG
jgi:CO/xanthine dehydrogenase Mo-binding subunit